MKSVLNWKMFSNNQNHDDKIYQPRINVDWIIKCLKSNNVKINDYINKIVCDFSYNHENKFVVNSDYKIKQTDLIKIWQAFYPNLPWKIISTFILEFECNYFSNKIYDVATNFSWRKNNLIFLKDIIGELPNIAKNDLTKAISIERELDWAISNRLIGLTPIYWQQNFQLIKTNIKGSISQGINNGPDFIFKDLKNGKKIGVEIALVKPNMLVIDKKKVRDPEKAIQQWRDKFKKKEGIKGSIEEMKRLVKKHTDSIPIYEKCDDYVLILETNNCFPEYFYQLMEYYFNEQVEIDGKQQRTFPSWKWIFVF